MPRVFIVMNVRRRKRRRRSVKERLLSRSRLGASYTLLREMRTDFSDDCKEYLRVDAMTFDDT